MAKVEKFEDLICWQKARELVNLVYSISRDNALSKDYGLRDQLRRAAVSSMTNIAEAFAPPMLHLKTLTLYHFHTFPL